MSAPPVAVTAAHRFGSAASPGDAADAITALLAGVPRLPGASCHGDSRTFDLEPDADREDVDYAIEICKACPALTACREWVRSLPPEQRPSGVVAGRLLAPPKPAPLAREQRPQRPSRIDHPELDAAADDWLAQYLERGPVLAADVKAAARRAGIGCNRLYRAANRLGVDRIRVGRREFAWGLPQTAPKPPRGDKHARGRVIT